MSSDDRERDAFLIGARDFYDGVPIGDCPYPMSISEPDSPLATRWCEGWRQAEAHAARRTLELRLQPICADRAAERALVAWVLAAHRAATTQPKPREEHPTLH